MSTELAKGHSWKHFKRRSRIPWPYCSRCGLMWLKNALSNRAARGVCGADNLTAQERKDAERVERLARYV